MVDLMPRPFSMTNSGMLPHQNRFKKMNRNMPHRFTFESKRTFYFTKISKSFPLVTSCPTACPVSQGSDKPPPPILRYGTRPSTDRAARVFPSGSRDHLWPPRLWWSDISLLYWERSILRAPINCTAFAMNGSEDFRPIGAS